MTPLRLLAPLALVIALLPACKGEDPSDQADKTAVTAEIGKAPASDASASGADGIAPATAGAPADTAGEAPLGVPGDDGEDAGAGEDDEAEEQAPLPDNFEKIGVELCDQYVADYMTCVADKVPEADREAQRRAVFDNVSVWKQTAAGGKAAERGLQTACRIAREQAKRATEDWGCEW